MKENVLAVKGITETNTNETSREVRKEYTFYWSGDDNMKKKGGSIDKHTNAGVGIAIDNKIVRILCK